MFQKINPDYLRSSIFGFQDALVSTTGVIMGISAGVNNKDFIILSALVTVSVEAMSMAAGQYLSEKSVHELPQNHHHDSLIIGGLLMFFSYIIGGLIPIIPILFVPFQYFPVVSTVFAFIGLFALGFLKAKFFTGKVWRSAIESLVIGGLATLIGLFIGSIFKISA
jgi:VIT1/CCC1 family predicted Fe2+/Mn2+ transporter